MRIRLVWLASLARGREAALYNRLLLIFRSESIIHRANFFGVLGFYSDNQNNRDTKIKGTKEKPDPPPSREAALYITAYLNFPFWNLNLNFLFWNLKCNSSYPFFEFEM